MREPKKLQLGQVCVACLRIITTPLNEDTLEYLKEQANTLGVDSLTEMQQCALLRPVCQECYDNA